MSKKKHKKNPKQQPHKDAKTLHDYSALQLAVMPKSMLLELMLDDEQNRALAYPYSVMDEVHEFIDSYKMLQSSCLAKLMADLESSGVMNGTTITMDRRATSVIKATAKTASFKQLDSYKAKASEMYKKLLRATELLEVALSQSPMEDSRKEALRMVMSDTKKRLQATFDFLIDEGEVTEDD